MKTIPHRELRNHSSDVLRRVQAGETIQVTNHGEVVAVLSPPGQGLAPRVAAARRRGGFAAIPRVRSAETTRQALDALHVAAALRWGTHAVVTYGERQALASRAVGLEAAAPG